MELTMNRNDQLIVIVEDSDEDYEATLRALKKYNLKNPIRRFSSGDEALDYFFRRGEFVEDKEWCHPGLILLDLNIPGADGREVLQEVKGDSNLKRIPVVVFTTSDDERDINACYDYGANSYIQKPVNLQGLFEAIGRLKDYWFEVVIVPKD